MDLLNPYASSRPLKKEILIREFRYDNCYPVDTVTMADYDSAESGSPTRFQKMATAIDSVERDLFYYVCQWGVGSDVGAW